MDIPSEKELDELLKKTFTSSFRSNYVTVDGFVLPERYTELENDIKEFEAFDTDLWICGFPKTGTTWISEIAWLILHDFDYEGAKEVDYKRMRMLEFSMLFDTKGETLFGGEEYEVDSIGHAKRQKSPRTIKSHLPFPILPKQIAQGTRKPRIIYTARNPMDTCISYYHHCVNIEDFRGTFEEFCKLFIFDKVNYGPYSQHVLSFWKRRNDSNILFLTYENMKEDLPGVIEKVAKFLGKTLTKQQSQQLEKHVSFESMKNNPSVNKEFVFGKIVARGGSIKTDFIRKGKSGGYKSVMSAELVAQFRYWSDKAFHGSGLNLLDT